MDTDVYANPHTNQTACGVIYVHVVYLHMYENTVGAALPILAHTVRAAELSIT